MERGAAIAAVAIAAVLSAMGAAHADLKIEQTITASTPLTPSDDGKPKSSVLYYKGDKLRTEEDGKITIFDATANKVYCLNPTAKTYYETTPAAHALEGGTAASASMESSVTTATVTDTGEEKKIAGKSAHHYRYSAGIKLSSKDNPVLSAILPSIDITGDEWTIATPDTSEAVTKMQGVSVLGQLPGGTGKNWQPLTEKMAIIKGIALETVRSMKFTANPNAPEGMQDVPKDPVVETTKTTGISEDALPDSLFAVPADFKKVDAPVPPVPTS